MQYLNFEDVLAFYRDAIGEPNLRSPDGLESALGRPQQSAFGEDAYPTLPLKTAALMQSLAENQSFVDGNKRIAWICAKVFLQINGATMHATEAEGYDLLVNEIANGMSVANIADWISRRLLAFGNSIPDEYADP